MASSEPGTRSFCESCGYSVFTKNWQNHVLGKSHRLMFAPIERAIAAERARVREAIYALTGELACFCEFDRRPGEEGLFVDRSAVLRIIDGAP